jgi:tetratricopeptide (TPR) repeat protein
MSEYAMHHFEPVHKDSPAEDLDKAIAIQHGRLDSVGPNHPDRSSMLHEESIVWYWRYLKTADTVDLDQGVRAAHEVVEVMHQDDPARRMMFSTLSTLLGVRFEETICQDDLEDAIMNARLALELSNCGSDIWWNDHNNLAMLLAKIAHHSTTIEATEEAIKVHQEALDSINPESKYTPNYLRRLPLLWKSRANLSGSTRDLEKAIEIAYRAVEMLQFAEGAEILSTALFEHYQVTGLFSSLEEALRISEIGLKERRQPLTLLNHGGMLEAKCQRYIGTDPVKATKTIDEAIDCGKQALDMVEAEESVVSRLFNMLGAWYATKMKLTRDTTLGDSGAYMLEKALELARPEDPETPLILNNLVHTREVQYQILSARGQKLAALENLNKAISHGQEAVNTTLQNDPHLGERLKNLAVMLVSKHVLTDEDSWYFEAQKYLIRGAKLPTAPPLVRIPCAVQAGLCCRANDKFSDAHDLLQGAISLLPSINAQSISSQDLQQTLGQVAGLATFAASIAIEAGRPPFEALKSLEEARCVIAGLSMSSKADISDLQKIEPDLASKYEGLRSDLAQASKHLKLPGAYQLARKHQQELLQSISDTEAEIRHLPGWESFQLPMTEHDFKSLATEGPIIVVNATKIRSDAIVVTKDGIQLVELHEMKYEDLERYVSIFSNLGDESRRNAVPRRKQAQTTTPSDALLWLWEVAVRHILDATPLTSSRRVWWITTGLAGRAPFHAAGDHNAGSRNNTLSRVISSYISSFKALRFSRNKKATGILRRNMLLVTMSANPPPHHNLNTSHEESVTKEIFGESVEHLAQPDPESVLQKLPKYSLVHFACHGASIAYDPSKSGLLLVKGGEAVMLSISDLEEADFKEGAVAYLSACSTAEQPDNKLADEAIHLANSFQSLGFQHVIGTIWGAEDIAAGEIAKRFYKRLYSAAEAGQNHDALDVSRALHEAVLDYRDVMKKDVVSWGPFIHIGA